MISIRRLASALYLVICCSSLSNAQTVDPVTGNLIDPSHWAGVTYGTHPGDCCTGGPQPLYDTSNNSINFSYGNYNVANLVDFHANPTLSQPGVKIIGYNYSWTIKSESQNGLDPVNASVGLYAPAGNYIEGYNYPNMYSGTYSGSQNFTKPYSLSEARYLQLNFQAVDAGFWAGYYGPQVSNISLSARYTVDPCVLNPLYASHCAGFNDIATSGNLVPNPSGIATWGQSLNQTFAISTALQHSGSGVMVHGFQWGYDTYSGSPYCASNFLGICTDNRDPLVRTWVNIKDSEGNSLYSVTRDYNDHNYWKNNSYSYTLPQSRNSLSLGNFEFSGQTWDMAGLMNMWSRIQYTPDQCVIDPLSSESCPGYQQAYFTQQCSINALYDQSCPGYQQAYFDQQCSMNALYDQSCPGYQQAYFTQQCSISGLYSTSCPNYAQAYLDQQCTISQLFSTQCPGYSVAYAQKMLEEQSRQAAVEETAAPTGTAETATASTSSAVTPGTEDATRVDTAATTDVGGVELSSTGSVSVPDGVPQTVKETAAASSQPAAQTSTASTPAASTPSTAAAPGRPVNAAALAVANRAIAEAAGTAQRTAETAVAMSQSENANPQDGTGATIELGGGLTLQGLLGQGIQTDQFTQSNQQLASISTGPIGYRADDREERQESAQAAAKENVSDSTESSMAANTQTVASIDRSVTEPKQEVKEEKPQTGPSVRRGGAVDGMSGGDMNSLAAAPADFNTYLNAQLRDSQFYASKEIYRGQRNVDNQRLLRGLAGGSDRLHQQMVDQQYKIGQ